MQNSICVDISRNIIYNTNNSLFAVQVLTILDFTLISLISFAVNYLRQISIIGLGNEPALL